MAMVYRGNKRYYYRSVREGNRVRRIYLGKQELADEAERLHQLDREGRRIAREHMRSLMAQDDEILKALRAKLKEAETGMLKLGYRYISGAYRKMTKRTIKQQPPEIRRALRHSTGHHQSQTPSHQTPTCCLHPATGGGRLPAHSQPTRDQGEIVFYTEEKSKSQVQNWSAHGLEPRGDRGNCVVTTDPTRACLSCLHPATSGRRPQAHSQPTNNQGKIVFYTDEKSKSQAQNWTAHGLEPRGDRGNCGGAWGACFLLCFWSFLAVPGSSLVGGQPRTQGKKAGRKVSC
jgi:hypothetical protein